MRGNRERRSALIWLCAFTLAPALAAAQPGPGDAAASAASPQAQVSDLRAADDVQPDTDGLIGWASPDGRRPSTCADWLARHPATGKKAEILPLSTPPAQSKEVTSFASRICVLIENRLLRHPGTPLYPGSRLPGGLIDKLIRYRDDLVADGYACELWSISADPASMPNRVRAFLRARYEAPEGLVGCLLVGDIFPIWFERQYREPYGMLHLQYPMDTYFSALYAEWSDEKHWDATRCELVPGSDREAGRSVAFDRQTVPGSPRIFVGRLTPSAVTAVDEYNALCAYLDRNHAFRTGETPRTFNASALGGIQIVDYSFGRMRETLERIFRIDAFVSPYETMTPDAYYPLLFDHPLDALYLAAHGTPHNHLIGPNRYDPASYVTSEGILDRIRGGEMVQPLLVWLDSCSTGKYDEEDYLAGCYLFSAGSRCLACVAPASLEGDTSADLWTEFSYGDDIGSAFLRRRAGGSWTLHGDPALRFPPRDGPAPRPVEVAAYHVTPVRVTHPLPAGGLAISFQFNCSMDTSVVPVVSYDPCGPVGPQPCGGGTWSTTLLPDDTFTVCNDLPVDQTTGDGRAVLSISSARSLAGESLSAWSGRFDIAIDPLLSVAISPNPVTDPLPPGALTISLKFSCSMDTSAVPAVSYDPCGPVGPQACGGGTWSTTLLPDDTFTVHNDLPVGQTTGVGRAVLSISSARSLEGVSMRDWSGGFDIAIDPLLVGISPNPVTSPLPPGALTISLKFSCSMDTSAVPAVSYDPCGPVGPQPCGGGTWSTTLLPDDTFTARNISAIDESTGDGMAVLSASGWRRLDGLEMREWSGCFLIHTVSSRTIHVDDTCGPPEEQDGSEDRPYGTIPQGFEASLPGDTVFVHAGEYDSPDRIVIPRGVHLAGERFDLVTLASTGIEALGGSSLSGFIITCHETAGDSFGVHVRGGAFTVRNNLIRDAGIGIWAGPDYTGILLHNNTIVRCGTGIFFEGQSDTHAANNIIVSNGIGLTVDGWYEWTWADYAALSNNCLWDNGSDHDGPDAPGTYITHDPLFVDPARDDFRLRVATDPHLLSPRGAVVDYLRSSPCLDAGTPDTDGDGVPDLAGYGGRAPDIGAFEYRPAAPKPDR